MLTPIRFLYGNLVTPLVTAVATTAQAAFPVQFTLNDFRDKSCRATTTSGRIQLHYATAQNFNGFALIDSNLTADGTVELRGSTDAFATSDVQILPPSVITGPVSLFLLEDQVDYTDLRVIMSDAGNPDGYIDFGKLYIGQCFSPAQNYAWNFSFSKMSRSEMVETLNKVVHFNRKPQQAKPKAGFVKVPLSDRDLIQAISDSVDITDPFVVAFDPDNTPAQTAYVRFATLPDPTHPVFDRASFQLDLVEEL